MWRQGKVPAGHLQIDGAVRRHSAARAAGAPIIERVAEPVEGGVGIHGWVEPAACWVEEAADVGDVEGVAGRQIGGPAGVAAGGPGSGAGRRRAVGEVALV